MFKSKDKTVVIIAGKLIYQKITNFTSTVYTNSSQKLA